MPKILKNIFGRNDKSRSSAFRNILFYQNIKFRLSYESFSILYDVFLSKKCVISSQKKCGSSPACQTWDSKMDYTHVQGST